MNKNKIFKNLIIIFLIILIVYYFINLHEINCVEPRDLRTPWIKIPETHSVNAQDMPPKTKALVWVAFVTIGAFVLYKYL